MLAALLTTVLLAAPSTASEPVSTESRTGPDPLPVQPVQLPRESAIPSVLRGQRVAVSIELTATHFLARNHDITGAWVVFENSALRFREARLVPRGGRLEYVLPATPSDAAEGWSIEVVSSSNGSTLVRSGSSPCDELRGQTAWFVYDGGLTGWVATHGGRALSRIRARFACAHVPVPLPSENTRRSKGRPIEPRKLPPV